MPNTSSPELLGSGKGTKRRPDQESAPLRTIQVLNLSGLDLGSAGSPGLATDDSWRSNLEPEQCGQGGYTCRERGQTQCANTTVCGLTYLGNSSFDKCNHFCYCGRNIIAREILPPSSEGRCCPQANPRWGGGEVDLCKVTHLRDKALSLAPGPSEVGLRSARGAADGRVTRMPGS